MDKLALPPRAALRRVSLEEALGALWESLESPDSRRGYQGDWKRYCDWLAIQNIDAQTARVPDVQAYLFSLRDAKKARATRARALSVVREVYAALTRAGVVESNPARDVKNPKVSSAPRTPWLEEDALRQLFAVVVGDSWFDRRNRMALYLLIGTGWRRTEIAQLQVASFRDATVTSTVKGGKSATVGVPAWLLAELAAWLALAGIARGPVLPRSPTDPKAISPKILYDIVKGAARAAGVNPKISPHALRRTFITLLRRGVDGAAPVDLKVLQLAVAHESATTTERYDKAAQAAAAAPGQAFDKLVRPTPRKVAGVPDEST